MSNASKKHHYVPQSILRRFSSDSARRQLYVFDKSKGRSFVSSIEDAGSENYFNTVEIEGQSICFEGVFQTNDGELARLLDKLLTDSGLANLTVEDRDILAVVVAAQIVRTKMARTTLRSFSEQLAGSLAAAGFAPNKVIGFSIPTDQEIRQAALSWLFGLNDILDALRSKRLVLVESQAEEPFWTSDNPVVMHNGFPYGELGLNARGVEVYFPISAGFVLGYWCPSLEDKIAEFTSKRSPVAERQGFPAIIEGLQSGKPITLGSKTSRFLNSLQVTRSSRFLYASRDNFDPAREILARQPELRDVQSLVEVGQMGHGSSPRHSMPPGLWAVFYGCKSHHMIEVERWDEDAIFLEFDTSDLANLRSILDDQPIEQVKLYCDRIERRGMREVRVEVGGESLPRRVIVSFRNQGLNEILRSTRSNGRNGGPE